MLLGSHGGRLVREYIFSGSTFNNKHLRLGLESLVARVPDMARVVDVGCGEMPYRAMFDKAGVYIGVDIEKRFDEFPASKDSLVLIDRSRDLASLPFKSGSISLVVCTQVLEHVVNDRALFSEVSRIVADDGNVILSVPCAFPLHETPDDYRRYTRFGVKMLCESVDLDILKEYIWGGFGTPLTFVNVWCFDMLLDSRGSVLAKCAAGVLSLLVVAVSLVWGNNPDSSGQMGVAVLCRKRRAED